MMRPGLLLAFGAATLCNLAVAQSVVVYGKLYPFLIHESASGATAAGEPVSTLAARPSSAVGLRSVNGVAAGNSYLGLRGQEHLGGGLKATFQLEGEVAVDDGSAAGFRWNRDGFVGLEGAFGQIRLGIMDTVQKEYGDTLGILGVSSGTSLSSSNILRKPGFGTSSAARFHERRANSLRYDSPTFGGVQAALQWATQENPSANRGAQTTTSAGVRYDAGPLYLALAYEVHHNFFGGSAQAPAALRNNAADSSVSSTDEALQFTVEWRFAPGHAIEFDAIGKRYDESAQLPGRFKRYQNRAYLVAYDGRLGERWRLMAHLVKSTAGACQLVALACDTAGLEGRQVSVGLGYRLSKRTSLFMAHNRVDNGASARFSSAEFGSPNPGEDSRQTLAGLLTRF